MASSSSARPTGATQGPRLLPSAQFLIDARIKVRQLKKFWHHRIQAQLWRRGNLTMQDYTKLRLQPEILLALTADDDSRVVGQPVDLDQYLKKTLDRLNFIRNSGPSNDLYYRYVYKYGTQDRDLDLSGTVNARKLLPVVIRYNDLEMFSRVLNRMLELAASHPQVAGYLVNLAREFMPTIFRYRRFEMLELLLERVPSARPSLWDVVRGGRLSDMERFGYQQEIQGQIDPEVAPFFGLTSPDMFRYWYDNLEGQDETDITIALEIAVAAALDNENLVLLRYLLTLDGSEFDRIIDYVLGSDEPRASLSRLIEKGNAELLELVFDCLNRLHNPFYGL